MEYDKAGRVVTFQSWKLISIEKPYSIAERLQWSHDISVMETNNFAMYSASDLLLQWSHDISVMETSMPIIHSLCLGSASMEP